MKYRTILIVVVVLLALIAVGVFIFGVRRSGNETFVGELEVWSFEDKDAWIHIIEGFRKEYPDLDVVYVQKNPATYETELLNALAAGKGPDVFVMHHTWTARHKDKIVPLPEDLMSVEEFEQTFVPVATHDLVSGGHTYGLPLYVDTLALYYNEDLFNVSGVIAAPRTWNEFNNVVQKTTLKNEAGDIVQAGVGLGTAENVEHAADILAMFMLQNGTSMTDSETHAARFQREEGGGSPGENALRYYTNFASPFASVYTWNRRLPYSLEAFLNGQSAMYIGYASDLATLHDVPIQFRVTPIPQAALREGEPSYRDLSHARYFAGTVSATSERAEAAWTFLLFATSHNGLSSYLAETGLPTSRRDLIESQSTDRSTGQTVGIFAKQVLTAASWMEPNEKEVDRIFEEMIEDVSLRGQNPSEALSTAARKYNTLVGIE